MARTDLSEVEQAAMTDMAHIEILAMLARPISDDDWGSDRQIAAEALFFACVGDLGEAFDQWCLKATTEEMLDEALRLLRLRSDAR